MSNEQLHSLDEHDLVSEWKDDGEILSPEDQLTTLSNIADVKEDTDQRTETFKKLPPQTDEATGAARRAELAQRIAEEDQQAKAVELVQAIDKQYDRELREAAAKIIEKRVLEDIKVDPNNAFAKVAAKYASRVALGLSELPPMKQEEGEQ